MFPSIEEVRKAAAEARRARADGASSEKKAVAKVARKKTKAEKVRAIEAEEPRKGPRSPSPAQSQSPTSLTHRPRIERKADVDLTADTPPEGPVADMQPPPPTVPEARANEVAPEPIPETAPQAEVVANDDLPRAEGAANEEPPRAVEETGTSSIPNIAPSASEPAAEDEAVLSF